MSEAAREILPETDPVQETPQMPMRWHGFLVKFYLWLEAAFRLFQSGWIFSGRLYPEAAARDAIHAAMPGMRILDLTLAALLAAGALMLILAGIKLAGRRRAGIRLLKGAYILLALTFAGYLLARLLISGMPPLSLPLLGQAVSCAALLWINHDYYRKRPHALKS